jgi:hypothetical protein
MFWPDVIWPYQGKRYMQMFPPVQAPQQQQSPHMVPPGPPPIPPPPYEEDQSIPRGYVYAYPPYAYPGQVRRPAAPYLFFFFFLSDITDSR